MRPIYADGELTSPTVCLDLDLPRINHEADTRVAVDNIEWRCATGCLPMQLKSCFSTVARKRPVSSVSSVSYVSYCHTSGVTSHAVGQRTICCSGGTPELSRINVDPDIPLWERKLPVVCAYPRGKKESTKSSRDRREGHWRRRL